jgi:hypothetical protein
VREAAADGLRTPAAPLRHRERIQESFGEHDVSTVRAHVGPEATASAIAAGARAFTAGEDVVFAGEPTLETAAHEAAHVIQQRGRVDVHDGVGRSGDRYERHAETVAATVAAGGSAEDLLGPVDAPEAATGARAVQLLDYGDPNHQAIQQIMAAAGIHNFGPFVWDADVPRFKLGPGPHLWTIADCVNAPVYQPEMLPAVAGERGTKQGLIDMRRLAAMDQVFGARIGVAQQIMAVNNGLTPRPFVSVAAEDGYVHGHTTERHILAAGVMAGHRQVALRAAFRNVGGIQMDLDAAGTASVFADVATADAAVGAAVAAAFVGDWRRTLALGNQITATVPVAHANAAYTKVDPPLDAAYAAGEMPAYIDPAQPGQRELFDGDYMAGQPNPPDLSRARLATVRANFGNVYVVIQPGPLLPGGWAVYTAYPRP